MTLHVLLRSRFSRLLLIVAVLILLPITARLILQQVSKAITADPRLSPPSVQIRQQSEHQAPDLVLDEDLGFIMPPNLDEIIETRDYSYRLSTDSRGFPNAGPWPTRADIVFLGDSLLEAEGVGVEKGFVALLGAALPGVTVLNLGNPAAGPERQYRFFRQFGAEQTPRLVIACLYLAADLEGDTQFHAWLAESEGMDYQKFASRFQSSLSASSKYDPRRWLKYNPSYLWLQSVVEPRLWGDLRILHRRMFADGSEVFFDRDTVKFAQQSFSGDEEMFTRLSQSIEKLRGLAAEKGAELAVVLIPSKEELFAQDPASRPDGAAAVVSRQLLESGVPVLDLYPVLAASAGKQAPYFKRDIHLNVYGNQVVADALLRWPTILGLQTQGRE